MIKATITPWGEIVAFITVEYKIFLKSFVRFS